MSPAAFVSHVSTLSHRIGWAGRFGRWLVCLGVVLAAVPALAQPAAGGDVLSPERIEAGWNLPAPPLPAEVRAGSTITRTLVIRRGDGQPVAESWLTAEIQTLDLLVDGSPIPMVRKGSSFELTWTVPDKPQVSVQLEARTKDGKKQGPVVSLLVLADVRVVAPKTLTFGPMVAGCALDLHCKPLELTGSKALDKGTPLKLTRPAPTAGAGWPELLVHVRVGKGAPLQQMPRGAEVGWLHDPTQVVEVCYAPPQCKPVPAATTEALVLAPVGKQLAEPARLATLTLAAAVAPSPWWQCYWWVLALVAGAIVLFFILYGVLSPHQFPQGVALYVGAQESQLLRDGGRPLYSVPGGRRGFYRSATCSFDGSGATVRSSRGGALVLAAGPRKSIRLQSRGAVLEIKVRGVWRPLDPQVEPELQRGVVHRVNKQFFFRVDG
jgi:hypothetical protein